MKPKSSGSPSEEAKRGRAGGVNAEAAGGKKLIRGEQPRVFLKRGPDGSWRRQWVGRYMEDGKRRDVTLCRWEGIPPETSTGTGDAAFEQSRGEAEALFKRIREGEKSEEERKALEKKVLAARYGGKVDRVKLSDLEARWEALPRRAGEEQSSRVRMVIARFRDFMTDHFPKVTEVGALTSEHFKAFLDAVDDSGVTARTWNFSMVTLRSVLRKVDGNSRGFREYLADLPKKTETTIHRRPFDGDELEAIISAAREVDPELHPVIVAAACTALRRGDVCKLRWEAVDLVEGFVTVKTSKTGETVDIPIFPPFRVVLEEAAAMRKNGVPYVWPKIALAYARNADGLNFRLRKVLAAAGFVRPKRARNGNEEEDGSGNSGKYYSAADTESAAAMVEDGMEREGWTAARMSKARHILALHNEGKNGKEIAEEIGISRGGVSTYLHEMEAAGKVAIVSAPKRDTPARATLAEIGDGEQRKLRGSLCGWHSFRTTFCTLALANGVPMEILRKITGHRTAEIVLKHYDRRGRDAMRKAFGEAMPKAIAGAVEVETKKGRKGKTAADLEAVALPAKAAGVAGLLADADDKTLAAVKRLLMKGGGK